MRILAHRQIGLGSVLLFVLATVGLSSCVGDFVEDSGVVDGGTSPPDSGPIDAGSVDSGPIDAGPIDAGPIDAGPVCPGPVEDAGEMFTSFSGALEVASVAPDVVEFTATPGWRVQPTCAAIEGAMLSEERAAGVVTKLAAFGPDREFFVGTMVKPMPWSASVLTSEFVAVVFIDVETGEVAGCEPLPEPAPNIGSRFAGRMTAVDGAVYITWTEGWPGDVGDEANATCDDCVEFWAQTLWRSDGGPLTQIKYLPMPLSTSLSFTPLPEERYLLKEGGMMLGMYNRDGTQVWRGTVDEDILGVCLGGKIGALIREPDGSVSVTYSQVIDGQSFDGSIRLGNGPPTRSEGRYAPAPEIGNSGVVATYQYQDENWLVGGVTVRCTSSSSRTQRDGLLCASNETEVLNWVHESAGNFVVDEYPFFSGSILNVASSGDNAVISYRKAANEMAVSILDLTTREHIDLTFEGTEPRRMSPFLVNGGAIIQTDDGVVRVDAEFLRPPDSQYARGFRAGGNTNSGYVTLPN